MEIIKQFYKLKPRKALEFCLSEFQKYLEMKKGLEASIYARHALNFANLERSASLRISTLQTIVTDLLNKQFDRFSLDFNQPLLAAGLALHDKELVSLAIKSLYAFSKNNYSNFGYRIINQHLSYIKENNLLKEEFELREPTGLIDYSSNLLEQLKKETELIDLEDLLANYLCLATKHNDLELINFLINQGHPINVFSYCNKSPLHLALENKNFLLANQLIDLGQNLLMRDLNGELAILKTNVAFLNYKNNLEYKDFLII